MIDNIERRHGMFIAKEEVKDEVPSAEDDQIHL